MPLPPPNMPNGISIRNAAAQIPCCVRTLRKAIAAGHLAAYRINHRIYIRSENFETYVRNRAVPVLPDGQALKSRQPVQVKPNNPLASSVPATPVLPPEGQPTLSVGGTNDNG